MVDQKLVRVRQKFRGYYNTILKQDYEDLEEDRKIYVKKFVWLIVLLFLPFCLWLFMVFGCKVNFLWICCCIIFASFHRFYLEAMATACEKLADDYKSKTKSVVMRKILRFFGESHYQRDSRMITDGLVRKSELFGKFNTVQRDDEFMITHNGVNITVSEECIAYERGNGKSNVFYGVLILLNFKKKFSGLTLVREKCTRMDMFEYVFNGVFLFFMSGCGGALFLESLDEIPFWKWFWTSFLIFLAICMMILLECIWFRKKTAKEKIFLEDVEFSKKWKVTAGDQIEARYVLTPALMERMLRVKKCFHGKKIDFSFFDDKCLIAVHTNKDMFETTSLFTKALSYHKVNEVVTQLYSICSMVDLLKISQKEK